MFDQPASGLYLKSATAEARVVARARIILACLEGKEIQQAREQRVSVPSVSKWRKRFSLGAERTKRPAAAGQGR